MQQGARVGVIGGSGLYRLLEARDEVRLETPYGPTSDAITLAEIHGRAVAFVPRHGREHTLPPHRVPYRANLWALRELGVERVLGPCAVGSLRSDLAPGDVVVCDGLVDRTSGRADTYFDGPDVAHLSAADPYCPELGELGAAAAAAEGMRVHRGGVIVVIQGPRFSTRAESRWFAAAGWSVVGMTQYPEVVLARELGLCYATLALVTDYDSGLEDDPGVRPVTQEQVLAVFAENTGRLRAALLRTVSSLPAVRACSCAERPRPLGR
ncbi:MAG: S-methyl-5'-thioadenosine phosphorylase [Candidatus Dormibacteria bacterium]